MSNTTTNAQAAIEKKSQVWNKLRKEIGTLRIISLILIAITISLVVCVVKQYANANEIASERDMYREKYESVTGELDALNELNSVLEDEKDALKAELFDRENKIKSLESKVNAIDNYRNAILTQYSDIPLDDDLIVYIYDSALNANIPPEILFSIARVESNYNLNIVSATDDHGLFQINKCNFSWLSNAVGYTYNEFAENIYDGRLNTDCAIIILTAYIKNYRNSNWHHVLMRYNLGPGGADNMFSDGIYSTYYSRLVLSHAENTFGFTDIELK